MLLGCEHNTFKFSRNCVNYYATLCSTMDNALDLQQNATQFKFCSDKLFFFSFLNLHFNCVFTASVN